MLVLSRRNQEEIVLDYHGEKIIIKVIDIDRGRVRIGVICSKDIPIYRKELLEPSNSDGVKE